MELDPKSLIGTRVILLDKDLENVLAVGILYFYGKNEYLEGWDLQATIDRSPYQLDNSKQVMPFNNELLRYEIFKFIKRI